MKINKEMTEETFRDLLIKHVQPMFTGSSLGRGDQLIRIPKPYATLRNSQTMLIRWPGIRRRFALKRSQYFEQPDARLVSEFIRNLARAKSLYGTESFRDLIDPSIRRAIARQVAPKFDGLVARLITQFEHWAQQTYEGRPISAAIGIDPQQGASSDVKVSSELPTPHGIVIANGLESFLTVSKEGRFIDRVTVQPDHAFNNIRAPIRFASVAQWADADRIAIVLTRNGEILIFKGRALVFAKRRGAWRHFPLKAIIASARINSHFPRNLVEALILTCLDVSFAKTGGGIGLVGATALRQFRAKKIVSAQDALNSGEPKSQFLTALIRDREFYELDRWLRMDLAAIDGSTIVERDGRIHAVGAILKITAGSRGGGRQSAAETIGRYGLGVKISSDGEIRGYWASRYRRKSQQRFAFG
jgi:hypothetical protein